MLPVAFYEVRFFPVSAARREYPCRIEKRVTPNFKRGPLGPGEWAIRQRCAKSPIFTSSANALDFGKAHCPLAFMPLTSAIPAFEGPFQSLPTRCSWILTRFSKAALLSNPRRAPRADKRWCEQFRAEAFGVRASLRRWALGVGSYSV